MDQQLDVDISPQTFNRGNPIPVEWGGKHRQLIDGLGRCSPNRWDPANRGAFRPSQSQKLCEDIHGLLEQAVKECLGGEVRVMAFNALGKLKHSLFTEGAMNKFRKDWIKLLPPAADLERVPEGQPFYLPLVGHTLEQMGDPDFQIIHGPGETFSNGVPVGFDKPLPRTPSVFPAKTKHRKLDDSEYNPWAENYSSAEEVANMLLEKFREEEALGRMVPTTMGELKNRFPDVQPLVAAMGAVTKPNGDVRPSQGSTQ